MAILQMEESIKGSSEHTQILYTRKKEILGLYFIFFWLQKGLEIGLPRAMMHLSAASNIAGQIFRKHSCTTSKPNPNG